MINSKLNEKRKTTLRFYNKDRSINQSIDPSFVRKSNRAREKEREREREREREAEFKFEEVGEKKHTPGTRLLSRRNAYSVALLEHE